MHGTQIENEYGTTAVIVKWTIITILEKFIADLTQLNKWIHKSMRK